jgi:hypothetical protein
MVPCPADAHPAGDGWTALHLTLRKGLLRPEQFHVLVADKRVHVNNATLKGE